ncbi:DUF6263 family protein [uncultured Corynebacterium sp.]|uniref:DUF6263 family protein n=1 Tax=uncultured Corynebacterium sp. TaxID=159447 RepID=UPI002596F5C6|nr:DUF6263 family protein [uncultured Corynebacterium sp.]
MTNPTAPTRRRGLAGAAALACALALASCSSSDTDTVLLDGVPAFAADQARVTLVDAGENPRVLAFSEDGGGDGGEVSTRAAVSRGIAQDVVPAESVTPEAPAGGDVETTTLPLTALTRPAGDPGKDEQPAQRAVRFTVGTPEYSALDAAEDIASAEGFLMAWRASASGAVSTVKLLAPDSSTERGRGVVESTLLTLMSTNVVFPEEPVGEGGSWTVENRVTGDASMMRTTTYTLERVDGDRLTLGVEVAERPTQRSVSIDNEVAGELNGQTLTVETSETTSEGRIEVDLGSPLPVAGHVNATTRVVYTGPQSANRVVQDITTAVAYGT